MLVTKHSNMKAARAARREEDLRDQRSNLHYTNPVIEVGLVRARDEQMMQNLLQNAQFQSRIYNSEIEPEHDVDFYCNCATHEYLRAKWARSAVQKAWSEAVKYPGEKSYNDLWNRNGSMSLLSRNPYQYKVMSPYGYNMMPSMFGQFPRPDAHFTFIRQTIKLNNELNQKAQMAVDALEPKTSIWDSGIDEQLPSASTSDAKAAAARTEKKQSVQDTEAPPNSGLTVPAPASSKRFTTFKKALGMKSVEEKQQMSNARAQQASAELRNAILAEENGRWPTEEWRHIVAVYHVKTGMKSKIAHLRAYQPIQYLHLLRAGYFEPIPVAWATMNGNPLKFSIDGAAGWRGITPSWRGYEDTAEERLYWVLNHREDAQHVQRLKPDFISAMNMARERMAQAVEPPPMYYSDQDTCHLQHTSAGYSRQVMPRPFRAFDRPESASDDTMILLDVSGSMDFTPRRPIYSQYLVTGWDNSTQPKNKAVAKAIIRRFTDAMANRDHAHEGYDLVTFANSAEHIGQIKHSNFEYMWNNIRIGGGTRVMTGWQKVKELHFLKYQDSATYHPILGWQAGPDTPMLRLLLLLDGEATDMDEFELDLLGLDWAHVTIFLIGVDGCPHHHRHALELQRISDVNHHVAFVDAQGNTPERFVTHELLKRHLGEDLSMTQFERLEQPPPAYF